MVVKDLFLVQDAADDINEKTSNRKIINILKNNLIKIIFKLAPWLICGTNVA